MTMIERPSQRWQRRVADQEAAVAAGTMPRDQAYAAVGVDVTALTARRNLDRGELTDAWRDW
jgi:hypothetical protein